MEQLEKVCKGLETFRDLLAKRKCMWSDEAAEAISRAEALIRQQQERIKELEAAQTAKWMTEEYIKCCLQIGEVVWLEWRRENKINPAIYYRLVNNGGDEAAEFHVLDGFIGARLACYGTEWRCWTQRPTDEQRKAVKWK